MPLAIIAIAAGFTSLPTAEGVDGALAVQSVSFSANDLGAGQTVTGTVTLDQTATATRGGVTVALASSSGLVQVPSSVTVLHGARSATFEIRTSFGRLGCAAVTARVGTSSASNVLYIASASTFEKGTPAVTLSLSTGLTVSGSTVQATVEIPQASKEPVSVGFGASDPSIATAPASITIPAGQRRATVSVSTNAMPGSTCVELAARLGTTTSRSLLKLAGISG